MAFRSAKDRMTTGVARRRAALRRLIGAAPILLFTVSCARSEDTAVNGERPVSSAAGALSASSAEPLASGAVSPSVAPTVAEEKSSALPPRELHPKGGRSKCVEVYSSCTTTNGQRSCTSAPFTLECGEEGELPSTRQLLRCVCP